MAQEEQVTFREADTGEGFQAEPETGTERKLQLVDALARTGPRRIEVTSFVRDDVPPNLAQAAEGREGIDGSDDVSLSVLVPYGRGLETALEHRDQFREMAHHSGVGHERLLAGSRNAQEVVERTLGRHVLVAGPVSWPDV
jgi:hydroxymethylglutaryl-CoA lyase